MKPGGSPKVDANGDGKNDLLWRNSDGTIALWQMDGSRIAGGLNLAVPNSWGIAEATERGASLTGDGGNNTLRGTINNDKLSGLAGNDILTGNGGADTFIFTTALSASTNIDTITDFRVADDAIQLENAVFGSLSATGVLASDMLHSGAGVTAAADANDFLIYNATTGALYYDPDGNGDAAAVQFATLGAGLALTAGNFVVS